MGSGGSARRWAQGLALASTLGLQLVLSGLAAGFLGYLLDRALGFRPVLFTLLFGVLGFALGMRTVVVTLQRHERRVEDEDRDEG
jgi:F0F1-type ATP synthase assembly protein I